MYVWKVHVIFESAKGFECERFFKRATGLEFNSGIEHLRFWVWELFWDRAIGFESVIGFGSVIGYESVIGFYSVIGFETLRAVLTSKSGFWVGVYI